MSRFRSYPSRRALAASAACLVLPGVLRAQSGASAATPAAAPRAVSPNGRVHSDVNAQGATVFHACYVPLSGTVYRIKEPDTKPTCASPAHVEFSWTDGAGGGGIVGPDLDLAGHLTVGGPTTLHAVSALATTVNGLLSLPANDVLATGIGGGYSGTPLPATGAGVRFMWWGGKGALRAGAVSGSGSGDWDLANIGFASVAIGSNVIASGLASAAFGSNAKATGLHSTAVSDATTASGDYAFAAGSQSTASGEASMALGEHAEASGAFSMAAGLNTIADGSGSVALGTNARTAGHSGAFVFSDFSSPSVLPIAATGDNQFTVRATGGVRLFTTFNGQQAAAGCFLTPGGAGWNCTSNRHAKTAFRPLSGELVLGRLRAMPVTSWRYRTEAGTVRHIGPTAQDFGAAFALSADTLTINTTDAQGVALAAAKALDARTRALARENAVLRRRLDLLEARLTKPAARASAGT